MNKTSLLLLLLFLVIGVTGAILLWTGHDGTETTTQEPLPQLEDAPEAGAPVEAPPRVDTGPRTDGQLPEGLRMIAGEEVEEAERSSSKLLVQVWDGKVGTPAPETDVFFVDGFAGPELKDPFAQHWSALAEKHGQQFETDAQGRVELPPVRQWAIVTAQRPGSYGFAKVGKKHADVETITLLPDETVTVRVTDGDDRVVAGVPVGVVQRIPRRRNAELMPLLARMRELEQTTVDLERYIPLNPAERQAAGQKMRDIREQRLLIARALRDQRERMAKVEGTGRGGNVGPSGSRSETRLDVRARRRTDAHGLAVFRHFQFYRRQPKKWWPPEHVDQFLAVLLLPLQEPVSRAFAGRPVTTETIELRMPSTGSVALRAVDRDGRPFTRPVRADLHVHGGESVPWARARIRKVQNEAAIVFPFVGLGLEFTARCRLDDDDFKWSVPPFAGPTKPGERVTIDIVVAPNEGMLFGRVLDASGTPLAGVRLTFLISSSVGRVEGEDLTLDPEGRFHLPYQLRNRGRPPFRLEIRGKDEHSTAGLAKTLAALPERGVTDLGDLRLDTFHRIAWGTVVDDRGKPLEGAVVQLQREREIGGKKPRREFVDEGFAFARADAEGHYELFAELEASRYRLRAQASKHFPSETPDLRRGRRTDLKLLRRSRVIGTLLTPAWLESRNVRVVLESATPPLKRREDRVHDVKGKKYLHFDWVRAGVYSVEIRVRQFPDPILTIDGLEVLPGQRDVHPRLQDIDLRALLHRFQVTAVDERGRPLKPDWPLVARIVRPDGRAGLVGFPWRGPRLEVVSTSPQLEVWPRAKGYRAERTLLVPGPSELRFLKYPPLELRLPGLRRLVGTAMAWIKLQPAGGTGSPQKLETWDRSSGRIARWFAGMQRQAGGSLLGKDDTVQLAPMSDGRYRVIVYLLARSMKMIQGRARRVPVELGTVDVRLVPGAGPQRVTVSVDSKKIQRGLAELAQREAGPTQKGR